MRSTMMTVPLSINGFLDRAGTLFKDIELLSRLPDKSLKRQTYGQWYRRTRALASALQRLGLKKGDRVATLAWNHHAHLEAYFGIPAAGGVMHTLNLRLAPEEIGWIAADAQDRILIVDDILLPLYRQMFARATRRRPQTIAAPQRPSIRRPTGARRAPSPAGGCPPLPPRRTRWRIDRQAGGSVRSRARTARRWPSARGRQAARRRTPRRTLRAGSALPAWSARRRPGSTRPKSEPTRGTRAPRAMRRRAPTSAGEAGRASERPPWATCAAPLLLPLQFLSLFWAPSR